MDKTVVGSLIALALILPVLWGMRRSWRRRSATSAATSASTGVAPAGPSGDSLPISSKFSALYVATTPTDNPLQRLNLPGLGFRARATLQIADDAIIISPAGESATVIGAASFLGVRSARVAIDRVVEKDGLTALDWVATNTTTGQRTLVTSFFRVPNVRSRESLEASLENFSQNHATTLKEVAS